MLSLLLLAIAIFVVSVKRAGANLHQDALLTLIRAPLRFFTTTDTGVTTNLFSQDLNLIDTELPTSLLNTLYSVSLLIGHLISRLGRYYHPAFKKFNLTPNYQVFQAIGQAAVILTSSPFMAISYPFLAVLLFFLQVFYLRTSRQLRLLDLEAKSPL
jgi:ABC-type multidrug transport system fused ATPase/permease subunit